MILIRKQVKKTMSLDELCTAARSKYNNMYACDEYSKVDPKDAKILSLTTRLENIEKSTNANSAHAKTGGGGGGGDNLQGAGSKNNNPTLLKPPHLHYKRLTLLTSHEAAPL